MSASFSALAPSEIVHCSGMSGLTMRQPRVLEYSSWCWRGNPRSGLSRIQGARLIDSTPPTSAIDPSPASSIRLACMAASRLDPHRRLTVDAGTLVGHPRAAPPCARRCGCPRRPGWRRRTRHRRSEPGRARARVPARPGPRAPRDRRDGLRPARPRSAQTGSAPRPVRRSRSPAQRLHSAPRDPHRPLPSPAYARARAFNHSALCARLAA